MSPRIPPVSPVNYTATTATIYCHFYYYDADDSYYYTTILDYTLTTNDTIFDPFGLTKQLFQRGMFLLSAASLSCACASRVAAGLN